MEKILNYINPIENLGVKKYSLQFPAIVTILIIIALEFYAYQIAKDPLSISILAIILMVGLIIYFSFREGIRGGIVTTIITIFYYFYIMYTRGYQGQQLAAGVNTTIGLGTIYFMLSVVIGWLKQTIDELIEKEANEKRRLEAILDQLPVGVITTDRQGIVTSSNRVVEKIFGTKVLIGRMADRDNPLIPSKQLKDPERTIKSPLSYSLVTGKNLNDEEFSINKSGKKETYIQVNTSVIRGKGGKIIAAAQIINDITLQKELEKRKDDFVNMASHELKTPLTSLRLYLDYLNNETKKYRDSKINKALNHIQDQTGRLQKLVNDLLDVSRLQTGKLNFTMEEFRLDQLIEETMQSLQTSSKQKLIFKTKIPATIIADRFRIYQVLTNLLTNAMKYSPAEQKIIVKIEKKSDRLHVSIQDFGIGIPRDQNKKIFERLYQVTDDNEKTFPGFGMGLYISREIIRRHKGQIWVDSEKGKGSTFYFSLPLKGININLT
jgi:PAS domain S-box-containing protein